jgi:hypothetical protein
VVDHQVAFLAPALLVLRKRVEDRTELALDRAIAVSRTPLADLAAALQGTIGEVRDPARVDKAATNLFAEAAPECQDAVRGLKVTHEGVQDTDRVLPMDPGHLHEFVELYMHLSRVPALR